LRKSNYAEKITMKPSGFQICA